MRVFGGSAVPQPVITAPRAPGRIFGHGGSSFSGPQLLRSQAMGWRARDPLGLDGDVALQDTGERGAHLALADVAEHRADLDRRAVVEAGGAAEDAGGRADDEALDGEQVLALDADRAACGVGGRPTRSACRAPPAWRPRSCGASSGALGHAGQHAARAELDEVGDAEVLEREQAVLPAHRDDSWADSRLAHSLPSSWGRASTLETTGTSVSRGSASAIALRSRSRAAVMNGVWKAPDTCSGITFLAPSSLACAAAASTPLGRAGDDDLARSVEVGDPDVVVGAAAGDLDLVVVEAEHGGHRARLGGPGVVHRLGRCATTSRTPSSKPSAPVAVRAVYSPRL